MASKRKSTEAPQESAVRLDASFKVGSESARIIVLLVISVLIWCYGYNRWSAASWSVPLEYGLKGPDGDTPGILSHIKAAYDGYFWPLMTKTVPQLGAPFEGNWNDFPIVEQLIYFFTGVLGRSIGFYQAVNFSVLFGHLLAAVSFYLVCRILRCDWRWAFAGALVFAFCEYAFARQLHHLQVLYYWHVPLCMLAIWWLSSREGFKFGDRRFWAAICIGIVAATQHPYYTNMFVQLLGFACIYQWLRGERRVALAGAAVIGVTMSVFFLMCANMFLYKASHGGNPDALVRAFHWLEFSALKPLDLFMPAPDHRLQSFADFSQAYFKGVYVPGEVPPSSYLGIIGCACLVWLLIVSIRNLAAKPTLLPPVEAWQVLWIGLYSVVGGFNCLIGTFGIQLFRSSNRYSIFILAIVLIFAVRRLSTFKFSQPWPLVLPILAAVIALWDQVPVPPTMDSIQQLGAVVDSDRKFASAIEKRLPSGAMVFQLPIMRFPEEPVPGIGSYDHFRPYLYTKNLRYSYGSAKGRSDEKWQQDLAKMDFRSAVDALESYGFGAIYINRNGFGDKGEGIIKALEGFGRAETIESDTKDRVWIILKPSTYPVKPFVSSSPR